MNFATTIDRFIPWLLEYGGRTVSAVLIFLVGRKLVVRIQKFASHQLEVRKIDADLRPFLISILSAVLNITLVLVCTNIVGIETTSFVAILSAAGLAVGFALQGSLSNFAAGVLLLVFKPFRVDDIVNVQGVTGTVKAIRVFDTVLITPDNKTIVIPNGKIFSGNIINYTQQGSIRVDMVFSASNQHSADNIRKAIERAILSCPFALPNKAYDILIAKLNDKAIQFDVCLWTNGNTYWEAYYYINEAVYKEFMAEGISPQALIK